jgi:type I restriction-modification system DNA methylase subunit
MGNIVDKEINLDIDDVISSATKSNWKRLGKDSRKGRLTSRANKRFSAKLIIPKESFDNLSNIEKVEEIVNLAKENEYKIDEVLFSLGIRLFSQHEVSEYALDYMKSRYDLNMLEKISDLDLPKESDLLGLVYQCMQTEGEKNKKGSYYTPKAVVLNMVSDIKLRPNDKVLDPCCGAGIFLFNVPGIRPEQIYGIDLDPIAVMISRFNYFLRFPHTDQPPKIYEASFLEEDSLFTDDDYRTNISRNIFDYIITNPPWGGINDNCSYKSKNVKSGEIFSYFIEKSYGILSNGGVMRFLLPESILNVKTHMDIRGFLLSKTDLREIKLHPGSFSGVMTQYISLETQKNNTRAENISFITDAGKTYQSKKDILATPTFVINQKNNVDQEILSLVHSRKKYDLSDSIWALGIVTGDNKKKLFSEPQEGLEPIYTGKEISPYRLKECRNYIHYNRSEFQQVAKDEIYRAKKKLVYKFISKKLVFSIDDSASLFLNSANILIPIIPHMSINSVAAFLNSELYQYLYEKMFGEIKILKGSLASLPFADITEEEDRTLSNYVEEFMDSKVADDSKIQQFVYNIFGLNDEQIKYVKGVVHGTAS